MTGRLRIGIDLGGTKIAGFVLGADGSFIDVRRVATPRHDYAGTLEAIAGLVAVIERDHGANALVGVGMPGSLSPRTGLVRNANSTWLNGKPLGRDLERLLGREIRTANDANCFALSEARDGAAAGAASVFGVILGTGCGAGLVVHGELINGRHGISGEWGHTPLPWPSADEYPGPQCWCGRRGCLETWLSGPALAADHARVTGMNLTTHEIVTQARAGVADARATLARYCNRLARGLAVVTDIVDPDVVVLGGGLSAIAEIYELTQPLIAPHLFSDYGDIVLLPPRHGPESGGRGAAWLWDAD